MIGYLAQLVVLMAHLIFGNFHNPEPGRVFSQWFSHWSGRHHFDISRFAESITVVVACENVAHTVLAEQRHIFVPGDRWYIEILILFMGICQKPAVMLKHQQRRSRRAPGFFQLLVQPFLLRGSFLFNTGRAFESFFSKLLLSVKNPNWVSVIWIKKKGSPFRAYPPRLIRHSRAAIICILMVLIMDTCRFEISASRCPDRPRFS